MKISKIIPLILVMLSLTFLAFTPIVSADSEKGPTGNLTEFELLDIEQAIEHNEAVVEETGIEPIDPDIKEKIDEWRKKVTLESQKLIRPDGVIDERTSIPLGTDYSLYSSSEGNDWHATWGVGLADSDYHLATNRNDVFGYALGIGAADAWAWTGKRFNITGAGSQLCYVDYDGTARAAMVGSYSGRANWEVEITVYDATETTYIGRRIILSETSTNNVAKYPNVDYSESILVSFEAGHQYVVQVITYCEVDEYLTGVSQVIANDSTYNTDWDEIALRWQ